MKTEKALSITIYAFMIFSAFAIAIVSLMAFQNPQAVMDLVQVNLPNTDAYSSIRGVYGGVGLTIFLTLIYLMIKDQTKGLVFASMLWGFYAMSRLITIFKEGNLGAFGNQWLTIESILCITALTLLSFKIRVSGSFKKIA
jgi:hypothetical protein